MPFLDVAGDRLYYEVSGSGPAIIFVHGLSGNHLSWWQQVPHFRAAHTCVTYSQRGWPPSTGSPQIAALPDDLARLIDRLELDEVTLVAQSMGGFACLP